MYRAGLLRYTEQVYWDIQTEILRPNYWVMVLLPRWSCSQFCYMVSRHHPRPATATAPGHIGEQHKATELHWNPWNKPYWRGSTELHWNPWNKPYWRGSTVLQQEKLMPSQWHRSMHNVVGDSFCLSNVTDVIQIVPEHFCILYIWHFEANKN